MNTPSSTMKSTALHNIYRSFLMFVYSFGCFLPAVFALQIVSVYAIFVGAAVLFAFSLAHLLLSCVGGKKRFIISLSLMAALCIPVAVLPSLRAGFMEIIYAVQANYNGLELPLLLLGKKAAFVICCAIGILMLQITSPVGILGLLEVLFFSTSAVPPLAYVPLVVSVVMIFVSARSVKKVPLGRIFAFVTALSLVCAAVVPQDKPISPAMKNFGDSIRKKIRDTFFFTSMRNIFSLANEGYYPQGTNQMGGKPEISTGNVMMVMTDEKTYLRGVTKDYYNGRCWSETLGGRRYLWMSPQWENDKITIFDMNLPGEGIRSQSSLMIPRNVSVRMLTGATSTLYVPQRITELRPGGSLTPYFNRSSEVYITNDLQPGDTYSVTAPLYEGGEAGLGTIVNAAGNAADGHMKEITEIYTQLPSHLQQELYALTSRIVSGCATPYDKAVAIKNYLSRNFKYTLDVSPQPENQDFVSTFLLGTKEGYCVHFASAMTVLARMAGLPARYVEGYVANPDKDGHAVVTGEDAHAWTEVYFQSFGWVTFDATPVFSTGDSSEGQPPQENTPEEEPQENPPEEEPEPPETPPETDPEEEPPENPPIQNSPENTPSADEKNDSNAGNRHSLWWLIALLIAALCAAAVRIYFILPSNMSRGKSAQKIFDIYYDAVCGMLRAEKIIPENDESPASFMARASALNSAHANLVELGLSKSRIVYGKKEASQQDALCAAENFGAMFKAAKPKEKAEFIFTRAFIPFAKK